MNEGHSAFMVLESIRELVAAGNTFEQASPVYSTVNGFHNPYATVPARER